MWNWNTPLKRAIGLHLINLTGTTQKEKSCPYDLSKPLPLHESRGHLTVPADFFFNNNIEYLRAGRTQASEVLWTFNQRGISHDVYSTMMILSVVSVTVDKWYGYGHLKEIVVQRTDQKLYKFMEGDFLRLHMNIIEDQLLLRVEDLQLGVESYQKKLNISKPYTRNVDISFKKPYTTYSEPQEVIQEDKLKRKRLMRTDELYKFSNDTLTSVHNTLLQMSLNFCQNRRDLPRDIPLVRIEVLRYDTKGVKVRKGIMQTKTELTLEQTQQGVSDEVLAGVLWYLLPFLTEYESIVEQLDSTEAHGVGVSVQTAKDLHAVRAAYALSRISGMAAEKLLKFVDQKRATLAPNGSHSLNNSQVFLYEAVSKEIIIERQDLSICSGRIEFPKLAMLGPFLPLVELEAASLPLVGVGLSTSQPPPYTVENGIETHNPWKTVLGVTYLLACYKVKCLFHD
ncbi:hypothetical protein Tco_1007715 [Tanacetum coccineum]